MNQKQTTIITETCFAVRINGGSRSDFYNMLESFKEAIDEDGRFYNSKAKIWVVLPEFATALNQWLERNKTDE